MDEENKRQNTEDVQYYTALCTVLNYLKTTRRSHYGCEDSFYNCPKHHEEPGDDQGYDEGECSCGADEWNKKLDEQIKLIEDALNGA